MSLRTTRYTGLGENVKIVMATAIPRNPKGCDMEDDIKYGDQILDTVRHFQENGIPELQAYGNTYKFNNDDFKDPHRFIFFKELLGKLKPQPMDILEIGAHKGECTAIFAETLPTSLTFVIDPWSGVQEGNDEIFKNHFLKNTEPFHNVVVQRAPSQSFASESLMADISLSFAFLDGLHTYDALKTDLDNVKDSFPYKGIIAIDDVRGPYHFCPQLLQCVKDWAKGNDTWELVEIPDNYTYIFLVKENS